MKNSEDKDFGNVESRVDSLRENLRNIAKAFLGRPNDASMRMPKVRAWDKKGQKMQTVSCIQWVNGKIDAVCINREEVRPANEFILTWRIGLKDKNNKEIFEGDILKYEYDGEQQIAFVKYDIEQACFGLASKNSFWGFWDMKPEIIGNIYENAELLEEK